MLNRTRAQTSNNSHLVFNPDDFKSNSFNHPSNSSSHTYSSSFSQPQMPSTAPPAHTIPQRPHRMTHSSLSQPQIQTNAARSTIHPPRSSHTAIRQPIPLTFQSNINRFMYMSYKHLGTQLRADPSGAMIYRTWGCYADNVCDKIILLERQRHVVSHESMWRYFASVTGYGSWHHQHIALKYFNYGVGSDGLKRDWVTMSVNAIKAKVAPLANRRYDNNARRQLDAHAISERIGVVNQFNVRPSGNLRGRRRRDHGSSRAGGNRKNKITVERLCHFSREEMEHFHSGKYLIMMGAIHYEFDMLEDKEGYTISDFSYNAGINTIGKKRFVGWTSTISLKDGWKAQVRGEGRGLRSFRSNELKEHIEGMLNETDKIWAFRFCMGTYEMFDDEKKDENKEDVIDSDDEEDVFENDNDDNITDSEENDNNNGYRPMRGVNNSVSDQRHDPANRI